MDSAQVWAFDQFKEGDQWSGSYVITELVNQNFLDAYGDRNPLHVDPAFARARGFQSPVIFGAVLHGFLSHFLGMRFPGRDGMLLSADLRYLKPNYLNDELELRVVVATKTESQRTALLHVTFFNRSQKCVTSNGKVLIKFTESTN